MSEVAEVISNPLVDGREGDFGLLAGFHCHADEGGIGVGWLDVRVGLVVDVLCKLRVHGHSMVCCPRGGGGDGLAGSVGHAHACRVSSQGRARGGKAGDPVTVMGVWAAGAAGGLPHAGIDDREVLQPHEAGQAVIQVVRVTHAALLHSVLPCLQAAQPPLSHASARWQLLVHRVHVKREGAVQILQ